MKIVAVSDTHGQHQRLTLPDGDLLIHAGDVSNQGTPHEIRDFLEWFESRDHPRKILVAGNHDRCLEGPNPAPVKQELRSRCTYLEDDTVEIGGLTLHGSPWTPRFMDWAFMKTEVELRDLWEDIPRGTDLLITHGPPSGILDVAYERPPEPSAAEPEPPPGEPTMNTGSKALRETVNRVRPGVHLFGHIHESYGQTVENDISFVNASTVNRRYEPAREPVVLEVSTARSEPTGG